MLTTAFRGRDYLSLLDYNKEEIETLLDVAFDLKRSRALGRPYRLLEGKTLFMIFYNQSLRTRNSFEAGMTQMGGHAHFLDSKKIYTPATKDKEIAYVTERVEDVAKVLDRMGEAIAIRCYGDPVDWEYGGSHRMLRDFAAAADVPIINMECDKYHPCQALADVMTVKEKFGTFKGVNFTMSWAYSPSVHKPRAVPQSAIIAAAKMGMNVTFAHPPEMECDPEVIAACEQAADETGGNFKITHDFEEGFKGAHVVYPKSWCATNIFQPPIGTSSEAEAKEIADKYKDWICTDDHMAMTDAGRGMYMHCLPADRGFEVTDSVMDGPNSIIYDQAENRMHAQNAVMALTMR